MEKEPIYISLSPEVEGFLAENGIDLAEELTKQGLEIEARPGQLPGTVAGGETREVVLVILASAALVGAVSMGISKIIRALSDRGTLVSEGEYVPVTSPSGDVVKDEKGKPILQYRERHRYVQPGERSPGSSTVSASAGPQGIKVDFSTKE
jgi:hypothetical protein